MTIKHGNFIQRDDGSVTIDPRLTLKFVDFGLAEFFEPDDEFLCDKFVGKKTYKAPEVYAAKDRFDARKADIWCLGVVLFVMFSLSTIIIMISAISLCFMLLIILNSRHINILLGQLEFVHIQNQIWKTMYLSIIYQKDILVNYFIYGVNINIFQPLCWIWYVVLLYPQIKINCIPYKQK